MTPTMQAYINQFEAWRALASYQTDADVRPLRRAAMAHIASGECRVSELASCLAGIYYSVEEFDGWPLRQAVRAWVWSLRLLYRGRPMWNDFHMGLWMLSRDPRYVGKLYEHLKRATSIQRFSGEWMVNSVCNQDADFCEHWRDIVKERGPIFNDPIFEGGR